MSGYLLKTVGGIAAGVLLAIVIAAQAALAYEPPAGTVEYRIVHSKYDEIGTHSLTFSRNGADLVVDVALRIKVKVLFITAHSVVADRRETWRDGAFSGYRSHTDENGDLFDVTARSEGGRLNIEGPGGRGEAAGPVFPTNPWHPGIAHAAMLMDTKTGELLKVSVAAAGEEDLTIAGRTVKAKKLAISGDTEREVWFDGDGNMLQFRFPRDGETLTFTRVTPLP